MSKQIETVEAAVEILDRERWNGRQWQYSSHMAGAYFPDDTGTADEFDYGLDNDSDAIAIAQGILDARRIVELERQLECSICYGTPHASGLMCVCNGKNTMRDAVEGLQIECLRVAQENSMLRGAYIRPDGVDDYVQLKRENAELKQRLEAETAGAALVRGQSQIAIGKLEARLESLRRAVEPFVEVAQGGAADVTPDAWRELVRVFGAESGGEDTSSHYERIRTILDRHQQEVQTRPAFKDWTYDSVCKLIEDIKRDVARIFDGEEANDDTTTRPE